MAVADLVLYLNIRAYFCLRNGWKTSVVMSDWNNNYPPTPRHVFAEWLVALKVALRAMRSAYALCAMCYALCLCVMLPMHYATISLCVVRDVLYAMQKGQSVFVTSAQHVSSEVFLFAKQEHPQAVQLNQVCRRLIN